MTPLQIASHQRHKRFHRAIAARAALVLPKVEPETYAIPNTPFGEVKTPPPIVIQRHDAGWNSMWFWDLVKIRPRPASFGPSVEHIQKIVAVHFGITQLHITGCRKTSDCVLPRQIAIYLCRTMTKRSYPEICRRFGGRDHTTGIHSFNKVQGIIDRDQAFAAKVEQIKCEVAA